MSENHFVVPVRYYAITFISLLILTVITVYTAKFVDLGNFNLVLAMIIASIKASLVVMFFMGLRWDKGVNVAILFTSLVFVFIFLSITLIDYYGRSLIVEEEGQQINISTPVKIKK